MARFKINISRDYEVKLSELDKETAKICKKAIYEGAKILADDISRRLDENLRDPESVSQNPSVLFKNTYNKPTGDLRASFGISPITKDWKGFWSAKIGFDGFDRHGVPNQLKARVMESGSSTIKKRPFVAPAVRAKKQEVIEAMERVVDKEISKKMEGV